MKKILFRLLSLSASLCLLLTISISTIARADTLNPADLIPQEPSSDIIHDDLDNAPSIPAWGDDGASKQPAFGAFSASPASASSPVNSGNFALDDGYYIVFGVLKSSGVSGSKTYSFPPGSGPNGFYPPDFNSISRVEFYFHGTFKKDYQYDFVFSFNWGSIGVSSRAIAYYSYDNVITYYNSADYVLSGNDLKFSVTPDGDGSGYFKLTHYISSYSSGVYPSSYSLSVNEGITESNGLKGILGFISKIFDGITNLPKLILDGLSALFVPDPEGIQTIMNDFQETMSNSLGFLYEGGAFVFGILEAVMSPTPYDKLHFPGVSVLGYTFIEAQDVAFVPAGMESIVSTIKTFVSGLVCMYFVFMAYKKLSEVLNR